MTRVTTGFYVLRLVAWQLDPDEESVLPLTFSPRQAYHSLGDRR
jgi:hypothetical protein